MIRWVISRIDKDQTLSLDVETDEDDKRIRNLFVNPPLGFCYVNLGAKGEIYLNPSAIEFGFRQIVDAAAEEAALAQAKAQAATLAENAKANAPLDGNTAAA